MHRRILMLLLLVAGMVPASATAPLACNRNALNREERQRYGALTAKLRAAAKPHKELAAGFEIALDQKKLPLPELAEWIQLESRCCPFLTFGVQVKGDASIAMLQLTGGEGVKEFLAAEFGLR